MSRARLLIVAVLAGAIGFSAAWASQNEVVPIRLPLEFPAVGNIAGVNQWRFGRLESVDRVPNHDADIRLTIRIMDGSTVEVIGPPDPLIDLAFRSNWVASRDKALPSRPDYVERMIAFDADTSGRLIAMASLEPLDRNRNRMYRAFGR